MDSKYRVKTVERVVKDVQPVVEVTLDLSETAKIIQFINKYAYPYSNDVDVQMAIELNEVLKKAISEREQRASAVKYRDLGE